MDNIQMERAIFTSTLGSNTTNIARSSQGKDENYGRTLPMLKSVQKNIGSSGDARLADDCCPSAIEPNVNCYWSRQLDEVKEAIVAANKSLETKRQRTEISSPLSVKEKRRLKWHQIRLDMERQAEVVADRLPKITRTGKDRGIPYPVPEKEKQKQITTNNRSPAYQNDASSSRYPPLCKQDKELKKDGSCSLDNIAKNGFSGPFSLKTREVRKPLHNTIGERGKECGKEELLDIPTQNNANKEVSPYLTTSPPIDGPNGFSITSQPVVDPIWRGRFDIFNQRDNMFEGFVAHLSRSACQNAIDEATLLPPLLQLEMVPKSKVWPKSFHMTRPIDYHIALYIFSADGRYEKQFDNLVSDMSKRQLAMRTFTKNAELLIFPSTVLEMQYWRYRNRYYIWGVFRGKI